MRYGALYAYHFLFFIINGLSSFLPKYFAEMGMTDSQIGVLMSAPSLIALAFMPLLGALSDRAPRKRYVLAAGLLLMGAACFAAAACRSFWPLLAAVSAYVILSTSAAPVATAISLEYCTAHARAYGPIRLMGTAGYQAGALLVAALLSYSLKNLYPLMGAAVLLTLGVTFFLPNVEGRQHKGRKVPLRALFRDRHVRWLLAMILFATVSSQFYMSFFAKHLGDLGMSNAAVSWITFLSVLPELPFLCFADRLARKTSVWNWLLIGMLLNGVRWLGLAFSRGIMPIIGFQLLAVSVMVCFEFMPAFYLARRVPGELQGSAQSVLTLTTFGLGKVIGGLLGGLVCERTGIPAVFAFNGILLLAGCAVFWAPTRRLVRAESAAVQRGAHGD